MRSEIKSIGIIPARYLSTRLPGKLLMDICGKSMIMRVYERAIRANLDNVIIATDDKRIYSHVKSFGADVVMTSSKHMNGTSRVAEVAKKVEVDVIVNIQGDEPLLDYEELNKLIHIMKTKSYKMSTMKVLITSPEDINSPNCVKVLTNIYGEAITFSRLPIPYNRTGIVCKYYKHIGIYAYQKDFLEEFINMKPTESELAESLEQLRVVENGIKIYVCEVDTDSIGVDTMEDLERVKRIINSE